MPGAGDTAFGASAELLGEAGQTELGVSKLKTEQTGQTMDAGVQASTQMGEDRRQGTFDQKQKAAQALAKFKAQQAMQGKLVTITPQIALGMVKNTGDKEWLAAVGQQMEAPVLMSLYTHGIKTDQAKKAPKITQIYDDDGKVRHAVVYTDEDGNQQQLLLDKGMTPEQLNKGKGGKGKAGSGGDDTFKKNKQFLTEYDKRKAEYSDPLKAHEVQKSDPKRYDEDMQWLKDNQDTYDSLTKQMGKAGGGGGAAPDAGGGQQDNAPFDADDFIKEALSGQ